MTELTRHLAAVIFTDLVGYTALIAKDEKAGLAARKRHRQVLEKTLPRLGGELPQYFGDGSLSIFRSAVEGVTASIEIQRELQSPPKLPVRVGLHLGDIAYDEQGAYGDAVNIAARIEDLSIPGGILISGKIAEEIRNHPELTAVRLGSYELKNVPDAVDIYAILAEGIEVPRPTELTEHGTGPDTVREPALPRSLQAHLDRIRQQPVHRVREARVLPRPLPLTGREAEMEVLRSLLDDVEAGRGGAVFISGDRGVGKSRLAEAVAEHARERGWLITLGRAYPAERAISFAPLSDAFLPIPLLRGIDPSLRATLMGDESLLYSLFPTLGPRPSDPSLQYADPTELEARLFARLATLLSRLAEHQPLLVILEDLQWADETSIECLHFLARQTADSSILLICQYSDTQPERHRSLRAAERSLVRINVATVMELRPLTAQHTEDLVRGTFDTEDQAVRQFAARLFSWTAGNPLFLEGTLRTLIEDGHLFMAGERWGGWDVEQLQLPRTVRDDVLLRVERLTPSAREVADYASVLGTRAPHDVLGSVCDLGEAELVQALDDLRQHQILVEAQVDQSVVYDFSHPLIRETILSELSLAKRRSSHGHVASALERHYGGRADSHASELAHHFARAGGGSAGAKAVRYLALAGRDAVLRHANREAAKHLWEALSRIDQHHSGTTSEEIDERVHVTDVVRSLARAETRLGNYEVSIKLWRRALSDAETTGDKPNVAGTHRQMGLSLFWADRLEEAQEAFQKGLAVARSAGAELMIARIDLASSLCYQQAGQGSEARQAAEESLQIAKKHGDVPLLARAHSSLARLHLWQGAYDQVRHHSDEALPLAEECGDPGVVFWSHWAIGVMEGMRGNTREIADRTKELSVIAEKVGSPVLRLWTAELAIEHAYCFGDWDAGIKHGESAINLARSLHQRTLLPRLLVWLSLIYIGRGDIERAKELTDEAWEVSQG